MATGETRFVFAAQKGAKRRPHRSPVKHGVEPNHFGKKGHHCAFSVLLANLCHVFHSQTIFVLLRRRSLISVATPPPRRVVPSLPRGPRRSAHSPLPAAPPFRTSQWSNITTPFPTPLGIVTLRLKAATPHVWTGPPPGPRRSSSTSGGWRRRSKPSPTPRTSPATTRGVCPPPPYPRARPPCNRCSGASPAAYHLVSQGGGGGGGIAGGYPRMPVLRRSGPPPPCGPSCPLPSGTVSGQLFVLF